MVFASPMEWLSDKSNTINSHKSSTPPPETLGILSFETAKTMSRLVSLYKSLSDHEVNKLRKEIMRSQGVAYLNSKDEGFLLNLACAERLEELDNAAIAISLLGKKCSDFGLKRFDLVYTDLKLGIFDIAKLNYGSKEISKLVEKMDKLIWATSALYTAMESLTEMEISERKINQWKRNLAQGGIGGGAAKKANFDLFDKKIAFQRKHVKHLKETSLWSQTFNKSVGFMARIVCIVYARICVLFSPYIAGLPQFSTRRVRTRFKSEIPSLGVDYDLLLEGRVCKSGPILNTPRNLAVARVHSQSQESNHYSSTDDIGFGFGFGIGVGHGQPIFQIKKANHNSNKIAMSAPASTVGGAGLTIRYANVIVMAEKFLKTVSTLTDEERDQMYEMLPDCLKVMVMSKLGKREKTEGEDELLADGWRDAVKGLMEWLMPMAEDTLKWHLERNLEKQKIDAKPTVLLLQTLHYSDKEKTDAAIAEVLVGLSFIFRYGNCHSGCDEPDSDTK